MKNNIFTIAGKEFHRFFHDKRLIISMIMPALILFIVYSFLIPKVMTASTEKTPATLYAINYPSNLKSGLSALNCTIVEGGSSDEAAFKQKLSENDDSLLIVFPASFTEDVKAYDVSSGKDAPNIELYYNSVSDTAGAVHNALIDELDKYESSMSNKFDVNRDIKGDTATSQDVTGMIFSKIMPMLLMILLFSGCMSFAPDSIAGEKERGTIATMLVTPIKRYEIVVGKIIAFSTIAILSGGLTFAAVATSLPKMIGAAGAGVSLSGYGASAYFFILLTILSTALLMISAVALISTYAKTTKEAMSLVLPLYFLVIIVAMASMQGSASPVRLMYLLPFYSSMESLVGIFSYSYSAANILVSTISNLIYSAVLVFATAKMFNNERAMFSK
jgi:sodium transport system permease protein